MAEQWTFNPLVQGSSPWGGTPPGTASTRKPPDGDTSTAIIIPIYNWIYWLTMVPKEVQKAKQMRGMQPTSRNLALYFFFPVFALQADLNDMAGP